MKIRSLLERPNGTEVSFSACDRWPAGEYHFKPDLSIPGAPHLAEVTEEAHINRFLSLGDSFRVHIEEPPTKPSAPLVTNPSDPAGTVAIPAKVDTPADEDPLLKVQKDPASTGSAVDPQLAAAASQIRELSVKELKAQINTYPPEQLRAAVEAEKANTEDKPRKSWIDVVEAHLRTPD